MHKNFSRFDIDVLKNLSYISSVVESTFNYVVNMKRHHSVIENDSYITHLICRLDDTDLIEGSHVGSLNLEYRMRSSISSVFSFRLLVVIQLVILTRQLSMREVVVVRSSLSSQLKVVYS